MQEETLIKAVITFRPILLKHFFMVELFVHVADYDVSSFHGFIVLF